MWIQDIVDGDTGVVCECGRKPILDADASISWMWIQEIVDGDTGVVSEYGRKLILDADKSLSWIVFPGCKCTSIMTVDARLSWMWIPVYRGCGCKIAQS